MVAKCFSALDFHYPSQSPTCSSLPLLPSGPPTMSLARFMQVEKMRPADRKVNQLIPGQTQQVTDSPAVKLF